jgi:hypothetical protein
VNWQGNCDAAGMVYVALVDRHGSNHLGMVQHLQRLGRVCGKLAQWRREEGELALHLLQPTMLFIFSSWTLLSKNVLR